MFAHWQRLARERRFIDLQTSHADETQISRDAIARLK
jgi:hypothetical protein